MKKFFSVGFATIGSVILVFIIIFTSMQLVINDETFVNNEFTELSINTQMGMNNTDLVNSTMRLIEYMQGKADDIDVEVTVNGEKTQMFVLDQEIQHMADVRTLYTTIRSYRDTGVLAMLILFLFAAVINFRRAPQTLSQGYLSGAFVCLLGFGFVGTWAASDFSSFWTFFHEALFWNDLWLFDATESRMINMLPEQFFADIVGRIFLYAGAAYVALVGLSVLCLVLSSDGYKRKKAARLQKQRQRAHARKLRAKARAEQKAAAEKAKRIAEKKKRKAALQKKHEAREKAARAAAEKDAEKQARLAEREAAQQQRAEEATAAEQQAPEPDDDAPEAKRAAPKKRRPSAAGKPKKHVADDTGFLDDTDE